MKIQSRDIRRLLLFRYEFGESRNLVEVLKEVEERLRIGHETHLPEDVEKDATAMRSLAVDPPMIYFLLLKTEEKGGELILFETVHSWYTREKILVSMRTFCRNAGIRCKFITDPYDCWRGE